MTSLQVHRHGSLLRCSMEMRPVVEASYWPRIFGLDTRRLSVNRCLVKRLLHYQPNCGAGVSGKGDVVARIGNLDLVNDAPVERGDVSGASLVVSMLAAILTSCPPALSDDMSVNSINSMKGFDRCSVTGVQANGYEYAYPQSWLRDRVRGIEVLAHDPVVAELNMSIFTSPAQSETLSGSAAEVGEAIIKQYQKSPAINKAELLGVDLKQVGSGDRSYSVELLVEAGGKQRHLLSKLIRTNKKVLSLTLQVPEELWPSNAKCMTYITEKFKQTTIT